MEVSCRRVTVNHWSVKEEIRLQHSTWGQETVRFETGISEFKKDGPHNNSDMAENGRSAYQELAGCLCASGLRFAVVLSRSRLTCTTNLQLN